MLPNTLPLQVLKARKIMLASKVQIDREFQDDGLYAVTFYFRAGEIPYYVTLARDETEEPDEIYFEAEDQICSFKSKDIKYSISGSVVNFDLAGDVLNKFFWTNSEFLEITIQENTEEVEMCLKRIFEIGRRSDF